MKNRRTADNRELRRLVLAGNLLATLLENVDAGDSPFARSAGHALQAWEHAIEDVRGLGEPFELNQEADHA